ncbi:MAG TPA: O-antigen ligase family protein [Baekduia sp.]
MLLAVAIAADLWRVRGRPPRAAWAVVALITALAALATWTAVNAALWGDFGGGVFQGFAELVALIALAGVIGLYTSPGWALAALAAASAGVLVAGGLAVVHVRDLHASVYSPSASVGRLEGVYGNPNSLGFALALALPAAVVLALRLRGGWRWVSLVAALGLSAMLFATFSRGSLLAAAFGVTPAAWLALRHRPAWRTAIAIAVPLLVVGMTVSPLYRSARVKADFGTTGGQQGAVNWVSPVGGAYPPPGAALSNPPSRPADLLVVASRGGQGAAHNLGKELGAGRGGWRFDVRSTDGATVGWQVFEVGHGRVARGAVRAGPAPRTVDAVFPTHTGREYVVFAWATRPGSFVLSAMRASARRPGAAAVVTPVSTALHAPGAPALDDREADYVRSRRSGLRMALSAFGTQPLRGLGLNRFPAYAQAHDRFGPLPTHNTYAQILAELGVIGALLLAAVIALVAIALVRGRPPAALRATLAGTIAAGAINLLFINGLSAPGMAMPLALTLGLAAAWAGAPPAVAHRPRRRPLR